jgi:hypothetical protein
MKINCKECAYFEDGCLKNNVKNYRVYMCDNFEKRDIIYFDSIYGEYEYKIMKNNSEQK